jgi:gamma-F420-2:alpha-L-glutamate ligase
LVAKIRDIPHLYQEYIPSTFGTDLRVVLVNHKVVAAMKRVAQTKDEFRSNIETGGVGLEVEVPEAYAKVAIKATEVMDLDYCGLDLLFGPNGEPILCEVNSNAYFGPIEKYSGKNVAKPYTEHVIEEIYGKSRLN